MTTRQKLMIRLAVALVFSATLTFVGSAQAAGAGAAIINDPNLALKTLLIVLTLMICF